jgi:prevent-host-death family protein
MLTITLKDAKAGFSNLVDEAIKGEFVTITRHGKPVAALVSIEAAEIARKAMEKTRRGLSTFERLPAGYQRHFDAFTFAKRGVTGISRLAGTNGR